MDSPLLWEAPLKRISLALVLLSSSAWGQIQPQPAEIRGVTAAYTGLIQSAQSLYAQAEVRVAQLQDQLAAKERELQDAKQKSCTSSNDGGSSTQPGVR